MKNAILGVLLLVLVNSAFASQNKNFLNLQSLIDNGDITHTAISDGSWFAASTWSAGLIPDDGAWVLIPAGIDVVYDQVSNTEITAVRVDGGLKFSTTTSSQMIVDTLLIESSGRLLIGTKNNPIPESISVTI